MNVFEMVCNNQSQPLEAYLAQHPDCEIDKHFDDERGVFLRGVAGVGWGIKETARYGAYATVGLATLGLFLTPAGPAVAAMAATTATTATTDFLIGSASCLLIGKIVGDAGQAKLSHHSFNRNKWTLLHFAASYGATEAAIELIKNGADTTLEDDSKRTFLDIAKRCGNEDFYTRCKDVRNTYNREKARRMEAEKQRDEGHKQRDELIDLILGHEGESPSAGQADNPVKSRSSAKGQSGDRKRKAKDERVSKRSRVGTSKSGVGIFSKVASSRPTARATRPSRTSGCRR